jgi:uncharacterized protein YehS (DUF1456 family)
VLAGTGQEGLQIIWRDACVQPSLEAWARAPAGVGLISHVPLFATGKLRDTPQPPGRPVINNDVLRSIRYMLDLSDNKVAEIIRLADPAFVVEKDDVRAFLSKEDEPGYLACSDRVLAHFLDGLIVQRRGRDESQPARPVEKRVSNNVVLKKLRVAFELKDVDLHQVFVDAGFPVSKPELSALFRQPGHKNFRPCGDQLLRNFLKGLTLRVRGAQ